MHGGAVGAGQPVKAHGRLIPLNLSIYWQEDTRRRAVIDNPKRDRIENFESVNEAYVVEDYRCVALVENIEIGDFTPPAAPEEEPAESGTGE